MATHSGILAWRIPWTEEPSRYSPWGHKKSDTTERLTLWLTSSFILSFGNAVFHYFENDSINILYIVQKKSRHYYNDDHWK